MTPDLPAFLFARVADREREAPDVHTAGCSSSWWEHDRLGYGPDECDCGEPARVLADCAAKRAIVESFLRADAEAQRRGVLRAEKVQGDDLAALTVAGVLQGALLALAQPFADHPGFREEWRAG